MPADSVSCQFRCGQDEASNAFFSSIVLCESMRLVRPRGFWLRAGSDMRMALKAAPKE